MFRAPAWTRKWDPARLNPLEILRNTYFFICFRWALVHEKSSFAPITARGHSCNRGPNFGRAFLENQGPWGKNKKYEFLRISRGFKRARSHFQSPSRSSKRSLVRLSIVLNIF